MTGPVSHFERTRMMIDALLGSVRVPLCLTDPHQPDNPIVYVNGAFLELVGYDEDEVLGRNCRFLQGPHTTPESVEAVRAVIESRGVGTIEIVNYRKDGSEFVNALQIGPILDAGGNPVLLFGSQLDVTEMRQRARRQADLQMRELRHRLGNLVNVMSGIIRISARETEDVGDFAETVIGRLHALNDAHFRSADAADDIYTVADLSRSILSAYAPKGSAQLKLSGPELGVPRRQLTVLALTLHELATNAVKHGALGTPDGTVSLGWAPDETGGVTRYRWVERGGPEVTVPERSSGSALIRALVREAEGDLRYDWRPEGLAVALELPRDG